MRHLWASIKEYLCGPAGTTARTTHPDEEHDLAELKNGGYAHLITLVSALVLFQF